MIYCSHDIIMKPVRDSHEISPTDFSCSCSNHSDGSLFFFAKAVPDVSSVPLEKPTGAQLGVGRLLVFSYLVKNGRERIYNFGSRMSRDGFVRIKRLVK